MPHLQEGQPVSLCLPDLPRLSAFDAVILAMDRRVVSLHAVAPELLTALPTELCGVALVSWCTTQPFALRGTLRYEPRTEHLRFRIEDHSVRVTWPSSGVALAAPVTLQPLDEDGLPAGPPRDSLVCDVAPDRLHLQPNESVPVVGRVNVRLTLPGETCPLVATGTVHSRSPGGSSAVDLIAISPEDRIRLRAFIFERLRDRRKFTEAHQDDEEF